MDQKDQKASVEAERISQLSCAGCQKVLDVSHLQPFVRIKCPECGMEQIVPAKFGSFLLVKQLGAGGMGVIYRAVDRELGRQVAIKVMKKSLGDNSEFVTSFKHEAQAAAALNHRNVVQIYSFGQYNGQPYIVMELVAGGKLDDLIEGGKVLDEERALQIHLEVAEGLMAASDVGLVHGDVKPANVLFGKNGEAKVVDFGLASYITEQQKSGGGPVWGTPYYIAPEKARGKHVDFRSDIYSLGATLFHVLAGKPPFDGATSNDVVLARLNRTAPDLLTCNPDLHVETAKMVARMLEADPAMRYPSYPALLVDMRNALKASAGKKPTKALRIPVSIPLKVSEKKIDSLIRKLNWKILAGAALAVVLAAGCVTGWIFYNKKQERLRQEAELHRLFEESRKEGQETWGRIVNLSAMIVQVGTNMAPRLDKMDKISSVVTQVNEKMSVLIDEAEKVRAAINESDDLQADAVLSIQQLDASKDAQSAKRFSGQLEGIFNRLIAIHTSLQQSDEVIRMLFSEAEGQQRRAFEEVNRKKAAEEKVKAAKRKAELERKAAEKKAEELKKMRPAIMQRDLDAIEKCQGDVAQLIAKRKFQEAASSFASAAEQFATISETRAAYENALTAYTEIARLKDWLVNSINSSPARQCWIMGGNRKDVVKADDAHGLTISLGPAGSMKIQWESVTVPQILTMADYYVKTGNLSDAQRAEIMKQEALLCYESGVFKSAEIYAGAAAKLNPAILPDLNRLLPGMVVEE